MQTLASCSGVYLLKMETTGIILLLLSASFGAEALPTNAGAAEQIAASGAVPVAQQVNERAKCRLY